MLSGAYVMSVDICSLYCKYIMQPVVVDYEIKREKEKSERIQKTTITMTNSETVNRRY